MQKIGILKTARGFALTRANSEKSAVVSVEEKVLDNLLDNEAGYVEQELMGALYDDSVLHSTFISRAKNTFLTENAFWHIHGILATALFAISVFFTVALAAGSVPVETNTPTFLLVGLITSAYAMSGYSLYALMTKRRSRKRRSALGLFMWYVYLLIYLSLVDGLGETLTITLVSLAGVAVVLFTEWSRPSK